MNASDMFDQNNNRAAAIRQLIAFCTDTGLSYRYTESEFKIILPGYEPQPNEVEQNVIIGKARKTFNIDAWGPKGYVEGEEPDPGQPLEEGEPPKEQL